MKDTFENLKHWLMHRQDSYWYENYDTGNNEFDLLALLSEVNSFAEAFERSIQ